jgi:uncharacterized RDD family membrane protein YckC
VRARQGRRAGIFSRFTADVLDLLAVVLIGVLLLVVAAAIRTVFGEGFEIERPPQPGADLLILLLAYLTYGWGLDGRSPGKVALGLRAVRSGGGHLSFGRAFVRAAFYIVFPLGFLWALVSRRNASVQDLVLGTAVIYDWGREARAPGPGASEPASPEPAEDLASPRSA